MQTVYIDLIPQKIKPVVMASQFDDNRQVRFRLTENGEDYTLLGTETVTVTIRKPDRNIVVITPEIGANNYVDVYFTEQACACFGVSFGEITIEDENSKIGTCNFDLDVELSPEFGGIDSTTELDNLQRQIDAMITGDVTEVVEEIAPPIVAALVAEIIGDNYLTKAQIEAAYYSKLEVYTKEQTDTRINLVKSLVLKNKLYAGQTFKQFTMLRPIAATDLIDVYADEYGISPSNVTYANDEDHETYFITVSFSEAFDHDINLAVKVSSVTTYREG